MTDFLHKKKNSSVWYFRRRYPKDLVALIGKQIHIQSLQTPSRQLAEQRARAISMEFDTICEGARTHHCIEEYAFEVVDDRGSVLPEKRSAELVVRGIPDLVRQATLRVVEEQQKNPNAWMDVVGGWQSFYRAMIKGLVPSQAQRPAIEARAMTILPLKPWLS